MTINGIIKNAVERLKREDKLLMPDAYAEAFCKEAKIAGMLVEDCNQVDKYANTLNKDYQQELRQYHLKTTQELVRYLISKLNRMNPTNCATILAENQLLTKRVLEAVELLHNKEAATLAKKSIDIINTPNASKEQYEHYRQLWINFITSYDDAFLNHLKPMGKVYSQDLKTTIENLAHQKSVSKDRDLRHIATIMIASLVPSIASSVNDKIAKISDDLRKNPELLTSESIEKEIKTAIKLRIALDKDALKEMIQSLDMVLDKLSIQLIDMIEKSDQSNSEIKEIKKDLDNLNRQENLDFKTAHNKLYTIAIALEENTAALSKDLKAHDDEVKLLGKKIEVLEKELEDAKKASREDFLTKLFNKRALDDTLEIKENEFERFGRDYSIVMFDIDYFKKVNDEYGHEAGDVILTAFANILKQECRTVDTVGRYGGEEFMAILSETDLKGAVIFAEKVREHVQKAKFLFQNRRIDVTVSAGVSERARFPSQKSAIHSADEYLYLAKKNGRNRIESP
ncbi:GGDEF domain-containing protein [Sulfurimonas sp. HSL-1716]|uniref:GGDEF domain-containing protein n=1 Tax=Hydrocurvibacter sulfurireducens TaxID=3131937 RepID=UPI0031F8E6C7